MTQTLATRAAFEKPEWYLGLRGYNIRIRAEAVRDFIRDRKFENILDIGCGSGAVSLPLLTPQNRLTLLDLSSGMLSLARSNVPGELSDRVETIHADFMDANLEPKSYDLIICVGVLAYVEDLEAFVSKLTSLLKPGGLVIVECSNSRHALSYLTSAYVMCRRLFGQRAVPLVSRPSLSVVRAFENCGLGLACSYQYSLPLPVIQRCFSHQFHYQTIRFIYGSPAKNRTSWLGNECIYKFVNKTLMGLSNLFVALFESPCASL